MTKKELAKKIDDERAALKGMVDAAILAKRDFTPKETLDFDERMRELEKWQVECEQMADNIHLADFNSGKKPVQSGSQGLIGRDGWRTVLFGDRKSLDNGGFRSLNEFYETVLLKPTDQRSVNTLSGAEGGFGVPELYSEQIWSTLVETSFAFQRCRIFNVGDKPGQTFNVPVWDSFDHSGNKPMAGVSAVFVEELATATEQSPAMRLVTLNLRKAMVHISASREALSDGLGIADQIGLIMRTAIAFKGDSQATRGTGTAECLGVLNAPSRIVVPRSVANAVKYVDVATMYTRMWPACRQNAVWLASSSAVKEMMQMETTGGDLIWKPGEPLLGMPVIETEHASALNSEGDLILVDFSQVALLTKGSVIVESSPAVFWSTDKIAFRALIRFDLHPLWAEAITPANSGVSQSWACVLK